MLSLNLDLPGAIRFQMRSFVLGDLIKVCDFPLLRLIKKRIKKALAPQLRLRV
jgi:hypothetical protein